MAAIDDLKQELVNLGIEQEVIDKLTNPDEQTLQRYINDIKYINGMCDYIDTSSDTYNEEGIYESISTLISEQTAAEHQDTEFFDPQPTQNIPTPNGKTKLITGIVSCVKNDTFDGEALKNLLEDSNFVKYDTVVIPLGVKSGENGDGPNHAVSLIVDNKNKKMLFVDQAGANGSPHYCNKLNSSIRSTLSGYSFEVLDPTDAENNHLPIMDNRHDCAIFTAYINDMALKATDLEGLKTSINSFKDKDDDNKRKEIDSFNGTCKSKSKNKVEQNLINSYQNNDLFKAYLAHHNIDFSALSNDEKIAHIRKFACVGEMQVGGNAHQANMSDKEKEDIRNAIEHANQVLSYDFKEAEEDPNYPGHLVFKDSAKPENRIIFASKSQAFVEGDQKSFDELIVAAKKLNRTKVNFGNFENKPQDKAKLYLACLKYDMEIGSNKPTDQELKNYPEWHQIQFIRATKDISKTFAKRKELEEKIQDPNDAAAKERADLVEALKKAREDLKTNPGDQTKQKAVNDAKQALENNPLEQELRAAQKAHEESIEQVKDLAQNSPAKDKIKDLPQYAIVEFLTEAENANTAFEELRTLSNDTNKNNEWKNLIERLKTAKDKAKQEPDWTSFEQALKDNNTAEIQRLAGTHPKFQKYLEAKTNLANDPVQKAQNKYKDSIKKLISLAEKPETKEQIESLPQYRIVKLYNHSKHINELNTKYIKEYNKEKAATPNWEAELAQYHDALNDPNKQANKTTIQNFETAHQDFANAEKALAEEIKENANKYLDPKATEPKNKINYQQTQGGPTIQETDEQFNARKTIFNAKRALAQRLTNTH